MLGHDSIMPWLVFDLRPSRPQSVLQKAVGEGAVPLLPQPLSRCRRTQELLVVNLSAAPAWCHLGLGVWGPSLPGPLPETPVAVHVPWLGVSAPNSNNRTDGMFWYLSHIADGVFQVEFMENIQNPIS